jgi:PPM family protein phosphatase
VGKIRQINEDRAWSGRLASGLTAAIVADGMGGHRAGEVASALAVDSLLQSLAAWDDSVSLEERTDRIQEMIRKANKLIYETASLNEEYYNMGTTVDMALLNGSSVLIGHIGDSRVYRVRGGQLEQLTDDHTLVNELAKSGQLSPEEAANHPRRNVITRALGTDRDVTVDVLAIDWAAGDRLLLCSDGLSGMVEPAMLLAALEEPNSTLEQQAETLIDLALAAGGDDNVTVALVADEGEADATGGDTA